ncbi:MAG: ATP-binding protein, partial [Acetatifactor sp.]|nr:ATP-binding protein [Acetatifactor sp.]
TAVAVVRQGGADFINMDIDQRYRMEWVTEESLGACMVIADSELLKRAVSNLIQNSINHNEQGCGVYVGVRREEGRCIVFVEDDGNGATDAQIEKLNSTPHYMVCDANTTEQRHGLGLLIVRQIAASHGGTVRIGHSVHGGLSVEIVLPMDS